MVTVAFLFAALIWQTGIKQQMATDKSIIFLLVMIVLT